MELVRASHILVKDYAKAEEILKQLEEGANFADLARKYSECPSKVQGGDLGQFGRGQMVPIFEHAAFALPVGSMSSIIPTQFGFHIVHRTE